MVGVVWSGWLVGVWAVVGVVHRATHRVLRRQLLYCRSRASRCSSSRAAASTATSEGLTGCGLWGVGWGMWVNGVVVRSMGGLKAGLVE